MGVLGGWAYHEVGEEEEAERGFISGRGVLMAAPLATDRHAGHRVLRSEP
jgi:hypothetical protein